MLGESPYRNGHSEFLPVPTYEEAISRPSSSRSAETDDANIAGERRPFLGGINGQDGYRRPAVESARSSVDLDASGSTEDLRREIEEMDIIEPGDEQRHLLGTSRFSKHLTTLSHTLSSLQLPHIPRWMPSWRHIRERLPNVKPNWIILGRVFALLLVLSLAYLLFLSNLFRVGRSGPAMKWFDPEVLRGYVRDHIDEDNIRERLLYFTNFTHVAGTAGGEMQALYTEAVFAEYLEEVEMERFDIYLNFPIEDAGARRVAIIDPPSLAFEAAIEEDTIYPDQPWRKQMPVFHGYSATGTAQGPLVYANYGSREDFQHLKELGVDTTGAIVIMRYYGSQADRSLKVRAAELAGAVGCIIYSDPAEDGFVQGPVYPDGRFMPSDGVQRGSVALTSWVIGDPLTPGYASLPSESKRESRDNNPALHKIPSLPLSWRDAQGLLRALKDHGTKLDDAWGKGGIPDIEYWSGDASSPTALLKNEQEEVDRKPIFNILGKITGIEQPEKTIIIGNHRDAWCFGAGDPNGGTAVLFEVVRILGELRELGWRPLRTIQFASWDAEEYNIIGSTEHVEARIESIRGNAFAYINVDVAATGEDFRAATSPVLNTAVLHVLDRLMEPASNKTMRTILAEKDFAFEGLDAGSDHAPFQMLGGCSSVDMGFTGAPYPYHSCYDNFDWMERFGDPMFQQHKTLAQIIALLALDLSDRDILPFDFEAYAEAVHSYVADLERFASEKAPHRLNFTAIAQAANEMSTNGREFMEWSQAWSNAVYGANNGFESKTLAIKRISHNTRMANFETNLLDVDGGLPGREQYKHVLFAPEAWNSYGSSTFPGVRDALNDQQWELAQRQLDKAADIISFASRKLLH